MGGGGGVLSSYKAAAGRGLFMSDDSEMYLDRQRLCKPARHKNSVMPRLSVSLESASVKGILQEMENSAEVSRETKTGDYIVGNTTDGKRVGKISLMVGNDKGSQKGMGSGKEIQEMTWHGKILVPYHALLLHQRIMKKENATRVE